MPEASPPRYLKVLSEYVCRTTLEDLPPEVIARARWLVADTLPLIAAGAKVPEMREFAARQLAANPQGEASVIGFGRKTSPNVAALLNGTAGTWLEMVEQNMYAKGLPASQIVPAALAMAEHNHASGADLLLAIVMGYEAGCRINRATKIKLAIHPSGTFGTIGAAVAVGKLAGLKPDAMRELINISATLGLATSRKAILEGATVGRVYSGTPGYLGILALDMVQSGMTGENDGVASVYGQVYGDAPDVKSSIPQTSAKSFDPDIVIENLGTDFLITKGFIKMHPVGRSIHPALDVIEDILARLPGKRLDPRDIEHIGFLTYISPTLLHIKTPKTPFGAQFSLPFAVASLIYHGRGYVTNFDEKAFANPVIHELALKVDVAEKPEYTAHFPFKQPCDVRIKLKNGAVLEASAEYTRGDPMRPRSTEDLTNKFFEISRLVWDKQLAQNIFDGVMACEKIADMHDFFARNPV
ncbi:MAG: MmgE/PrpD family protein [Betaproteobacteria bacterium]|nr:MmgE/PrpD family protein [Betaproteobacteria bacterium]